MKKVIVWGTCWLNESIDLLISFYKTSIKSLRKMNFDIIPIIFDAKIDSNEKDLNYIRENINNVIIIKNTINIFPNKNYGVALITNKAYELKADYIAIVDSDWNIKENFSFINNILISLIKNNYDIIIPDIKDAAGRSNILIGKTAITLFYPEYKTILKTPFPGSLVAKTIKLFAIVNDKAYHFDWGGEWDIISLAIDKGMKINSILVEVEGTRHRPNNSKIFDSFQIWRAILANDCIKERFKYLQSNDKEIIPYNQISEMILANNYSTLELIEILENGDTTDTEKQILYMILYPIAFLTGQITNVPIIQSNDKMPYDKEEIKKISDFAIYCAKRALTNCDIEKALNRCQNVKAKILSDWNFEIQHDLLKESCSGDK